MNNIQSYRNNLERLKGQKHQVEKDIDGFNVQLKNLKKDLINTEQAQIILQTVAKQTQQELEYHISELVTLALESVFDDPYKFKLEFVEKRGKTEAEIWFSKNGNLIDPLTASGGGVVDIASMALRIALWNLSKPKSRNTIILDEPCRFVSKDYIPKVAELFSLLSKKLKLQFIIVTHITELIESADKVFEVSINSKGVSVVK